MFLFGAPHGRECLPHAKFLGIAGVDSRDERIGAVSEYFFSQSASDKGGGGLIIRIGFFNKRFKRNSKFATDRKKRCRNCLSRTARNLNPASLFQNISLLRSRIRFDHSLTQS